MRKIDRMSLKDIEKQYTGGELDFSDISLDELDKSDRNVLLSKVFRYYSYHKFGSAKKYLLKYVKENKENIAKRFANIRFIKDGYVHYPTAWLCRMVTDCNLIQDQYVKAKINAGFDAMMKDVVVPPKQITNKPVKSKPTELVNETNILVGYFEHEIDKFIENNCYNKEFNFKVFAEKYNLKPGQVSACKKVAQKLYDEITESLEPKCDPQIKESYSFLTKPKKLRLLQVFLKPIINTKSYTKNTTKVRVKREKKKAVAVVKSQIDGSTTVWILYEKYNQIGYMVAKPGTMLYLKGKTVQNVDTEASICKKVPASMIKNAIKNISKAKSFDAEKTVLNKFAADSKEYKTGTRFYPDRPDYIVIKKY